ncbi:MAG: PP2C family protein-serine/threonine phosphatase [Anaerolineae bacterium]
MGDVQPLLHLEVGQYSHPGRRRPNNEDWLGTFQPEDQERLTWKGSLFLVADGMGGHQSGELASRRAVDLVIRAYMEDPSPEIDTSLRRAIAIANTALYSASTGRGEGRNWGTTLVAAIVCHEELWIANVGDSRAYLIRGGKLRQLSQDHSWGAALGVAPDQEWPGRHLITRALGLKPEVEADLFPPVKLTLGDLILLCTDGLTTPLSDEEICAIATQAPPQQAAEALVKAANDRGGPDNISVILIRVARQDLTATWQTPGELLAIWLQPRTWKLALGSLKQFFSGGQRGLRPWVVWLLFGIIAIAIIGMGFLLGLILF